MKGGRLERPPFIPQGTAVAVDQANLIETTRSGPQLSGGFLGAGRKLIGWGAEKLLVLVDQIPGHSSNLSWTSVQFIHHELLNDSKVTGARGRRS